MRIEQFNLLTRHIVAMHSPANKPHGRTVKYVTPTFDVRTGEIFAVTFAGFGWSDRVFKVSGRDFYQDCMDKLHEPPLVIIDGTASREIQAIMDQPRAFWSNNVVG